MNRTIRRRANNDDESAGTNTVRRRITNAARKRIWGAEGEKLANECSVSANVIFIPVQDLRGETMGISQIRRTLKDSMRAMMTDLTKYRHSFTYSRPKSHAHKHGPLSDRCRRDLLT